MLLPMPASAPRLRPLRSVMVIWNVPPCQPSSLSRSCLLYTSNIQHGALDACKRYFYSLLLHPCDYRAPDLAAQIVQAARQHASAGLVLTPPLSDVRALIEALDHGDVPYVRLAPGSPSARGLEVSTDDRAAARDMTRYLLDLGHRRIGFVAGHPDHGAVGERLHGYRDALAEQGVAYDPTLVEQGPVSYTHLDVYKRQAWRDRSISAPPRTWRSACRNCARARMRRAICW